MRHADATLAKSLKQPLLSGMDSERRGEHDRLGKECLNRVKL